MSEGMSGGTYPNRKWPEDKEIDPGESDVFSKPTKDEMQRVGGQIGAEILYERWHDSVRALLEVRAHVSEALDALSTAAMEASVKEMRAILDRALLDAPFIPPNADAWKGVYPGMCIDPEVCRGYTHCPRNYSCCE